MTIVFALCGLVCAACNDFIMKLVARKPRSKGLFFCLVGIVWGAVSLLFPIDLTNWKATLLWGSVASFFSITANLLLIESMGLQSAGICSTVYRLNLVPVAILACFLPGMDESISLVNGAGIFVAACAVLCFMAPPDREETGSGQTAVKMARLGLFLVIIASCLRAGQGLSTKYCNIFGADKTGVMIINAVFWIVGGFLYAICRERKLMQVNAHLLGYSAGSGLAVLGIIYFMLLSTDGGDASIVLPIQQMSFPLTLLFSAIFLHEKVTPLKLTGVVCGIVAVILLCL